MSSQNEDPSQNNAETTNLNQNQMPGQNPMQTLHQYPMQMQMAGQNPMQMAGQNPMQMQGQYPMQMQGQYPMQMAGQYPMQMAGQNPMQMQGQYPMQMQGQYPMQMAGQNPMQMQGSYPMQMQGQYPMQMASQYPSQIQQPQMQPPQESLEYLNDLFGCTKEWDTFFVAACIPCALNYYHAIATENATKGDRSFVLAFLLDCCGLSFLNRLAIRGTYNINGDCLSDYCLLYWCSFCAILQDYYEVDERSKKKWRG